MLSLLTIPTDALSPARRREVRHLLDDAFAGDFSDQDWQHTLGGWHVVALEGGQVRAHAAVVTRRLDVDGEPRRAGYVEGVATAGDQRGRGYGTRVMRVIGDTLLDHDAFGALSTDQPGFYERLGWERWRGPTAVREPQGLRFTPEESGGILVLRGRLGHPIDLTATLTCEARPGDDW